MQTSTCEQVRRAGTLVALLLSAAPGALAQIQPAAPYGLVARGMPMADALEILVAETGIDLVYSSDLAAGKEVFCVKRHDSPEVLLQCVLQGSGVDYVRSRSGAYVLIPAVRQAPEWGTLAGAVVDEATGEPLPHANIFLAEARTGTSANGSGLFTVAPLVSGPYQMTVTYVGYHTVVDSIYVGPGEPNRVRVSMRAREHVLAPVVIDGLEQRLPSQGIGTGSLGAASLREPPPGPSPDVARAAAALTGVSMQRPLADLHIQGSSAGSHEVLLDGAPVRDPVSLGRHLGAFSPLALGRLRVHRAGFGASAGSNLTGVLAVDHAVSPAGPRELVIQADPIALNARLSGRARPGGMEARAMVAARSSLWDLYRAPYVEALFRQWHEPDPLAASLWLQQPVGSTSIQLVEQTPAVRFSDIHAAVELEPAAYHQVEVSLYRARNHLASMLTATNRPEEGSARLFATDDVYDWTNWAGTLRHSWLAGARAIVASQLTGSTHDSQYSYAAAYAEEEGVFPDSETDPGGTGRRLIEDLGKPPAAYEMHSVHEASLRANVHYSLSARSHLTVGSFATLATSRLQHRSPFVAPFQHETDAWFVGGFAESDLRLSHRTSIEPGVRATYVFARGTTYLEPRLAVRFDRERTRIGDVAIRLSGGLYRQFVNELELTSSGSTNVVPFVFFWMPTSARVAPPTSVHAAGDVLCMPTSRITSSISLYRKWQPRLLVFDYAGVTTPQPPARDAQRIRLEQDEFITDASGHVTGAELRIEYRSSLLHLTGGYAFTHARRTIPGRFGSVPQPLPWSVPHELFGQAKHTVASGLAVEAAASLHAGRHWAFRDAYYSYLVGRFPVETSESLGLGDPGAHRLPASPTVDLGIRYTLDLGGGDVQMNVMVLDVVDGRQIYERGLAADTSGYTPTNRRLPGRSLLASVRVRR